MGLSIEQLPQDIAEPLGRLFGENHQDRLTVVENALGACAAAETTLLDGGPMDRLSQWSAAMAERYPDGSFGVQKAYLDNGADSRLNWSIAYTFTEDGLLMERRGGREDGRRDMHSLKPGGHDWGRWSVVRDLNTLVAAGRQNDLWGPHDPRSADRIRSNLHGYHLERQLSGRRLFGPVVEAVLDGKFALRPVDERRPAKPGEAATTNPQVS